MSGSNGNVLNPADNGAILNTGGGGSGGVLPNIVVVPWTAIEVSDLSSSAYLVRFGVPEDRNGTTAAADWRIEPGTANTPDRLVSDTRAGLAWWSSACLQCGPETQVRRAFLSAFYAAGGLPVGITGCASGFEGNNDRGEITIFEGGLGAGVDLTHVIAWNGQTPLTLNEGQILLWST